MIEIRLATTEDIPCLAAIELAAGELFLQFEFTAALASDTTPVRDFEQAQKNNLLWVAVQAGKPIGFALAGLLNDAVHLQELAVHPDHGRQGIGTKLIQAVCDWASAGGIQAMTLTTFLDIPWNAPFYQKLGFRVLEPAEWTLGLKQVVEDEENHGLARELRAVMRIEITTV
ncbi:MAG: GNAT family N-acetyltransferase [Blastocatellia bacterium]